MLKIQLLLLWLSLTAVNARSKYLGCFQKTVQRSVDNSQPMMELFYLTPYQCIDNCIIALNTNSPEVRLCRSFVYDHSRHSCRLYDHDGHQPPAILHPASGYDFYRRTAVSERCSGPGLLGFGPSAFISENPNLHTLRKVSTGTVDETMAIVSQPLDKEVLPLQALPPYNEFEKPTVQLTTAAALTTPPEITFSLEGTIDKHLRTFEGTHDARKKTFEGTFGPVKLKASPETEEVYAPADARIKAKGMLFDRERSSPKPQIESGYENLGATEEAIVVKSTEAPEPSPPSARKMEFAENTLYWSASGQPAVSAERPQASTRWPPIQLTTATTAATPPAEVAQLGKSCATSTAYYVVIGNEIILPISSTEKDVRVFPGIEQSQCARYCTANKGPKGEALQCSSMNYFPLDQKCEIYSILAEPHGPGSLVENDDVIYAEKFCLPTQSVICQEDEIFILYVQKKVIKNQLKVRSSNSITSCLRHCLEHRLCKAAVFDSVNRRCMLHDVNVVDTNEVQDAEAGWVLIENGCNSLRKRPPQATAEEQAEPITYAETQWTEWSNCQFKLRGRTVRVRTRQCESECPDGGMQVQRCSN